MSDPAREELISAYLDNEVTPEERALVEQWLVENAQLRQLHEDLLAQRSGLKAMPRQRLDRDLSEAVLQAADAQRRVQPAVGGLARLPEGTSLWRRGAGWRRVVWPAAAMAAALMILAYDATRRTTEEVALAPTTAEGTAHRSTIASKDTGIASKDTGDLRALPMDAESARDGRDPRLERRDAPARSFANGVVPLNDQPLPAPAEAAADSMPAAAPAPPQSGYARHPTSRPKSETGLQLAEFDVIVPVDYLRTKKFEQLLAEHKLTFRRAADAKRATLGMTAQAPGRASEDGETLDEAAPQPESLRMDKRQKKLLGPAETLYLVTATPEQTKRLLEAIRPAATGGIVPASRGTDWHQRMPAKSDPAKSKSAKAEKADAPPAEPQLYSLQAQQAGQAGEIVIRLRPAPILPTPAAPAGAPAPVAPVEPAPAQPQ